MVSGCSFSLLSTARSSKWSHGHTRPHMSRDFLVSCSSVERRCQVQLVLDAAAVSTRCVAVAMTADARRLDHEVHGEGPRNMTRGLFGVARWRAAARDKQVPGMPGGPPGHKR